MYIHCMVEKNPTVTVNHSLVSHVSLSTLSPCSRTGFGNGILEWVNSEMQKKMPEQILSAGLRYLLEWNSSKAISASTCFFCNDQTVPMKIYFISVVHAQQRELCFE